MKRIALFSLFLLAIQDGFSQGYTHFQSYAQSNSYHHKNANKVWLSMGKDQDQRILEYDLTTRDFVFLNDTVPAFKAMVSDNNKGVAISQNGQLYYTNDNWKTASLSAQAGLASVYKTATGFIGLKENNRISGDLYHSPDGNTWTKVTSVTGSRSSFRTVAIHSAKVWLLSNPASFQVSHDGGITFQTKQATGAPASDFIGFYPFDSLNGIGAAENGNLYRTSNGGSSWTMSPRTQIRLVFTRVDSMLAYHPVDGLLLSTDTATTWTKVSFPTPSGFTSDPAMWNASGGYITSRNGTGFFYTDGLNRPWKQLKTTLTANRSVASKGRIVVIGGQNGFCAYSHNQGRSFVPCESPLGNQDLFACEVVNDTLVLMADRQSNIFVSGNGGVSWRKAFSNTFNYIGIKFRYSNDLSKIILRRAGQLVFSDDKSDTWENLGLVGGSFDATVTPSGKILMATWYGNTMQINEMKPDGNRQEIRLFNEDLTPMGLEMIDDNTGYCFGTKANPAEVYVYKTTDGWNTFTFQGKFTTPAGSPIFHIPGGADTVFINFRNTSNADASLNTIYQTFDGGKTWTTNTLVPNNVPANYKEKLQSIYFFNPREFISVWDDNRIYMNKVASDTGSNPGTFVSHIADKLQAIVYPNPTQDVINIECASAISSAELYDMAGRKVWSGLEKTISLAGLPKGIYFLKISSGEKSMVSKVIKQ